jgi:hypothetical protein
LTNAAGNGTLTWAPVSGFLTTGLPSGNIFVGSGAGVATQRAMTGDATMSNTGALTIATTAGNNLVNAINNVATTASITDSKLATITTAGKVSGNAITSGTIGGTTVISTSGDIITTGGSLSISGTTTFGGIKYTWPTTPLAAPTKFLSTDAGGNLTWATTPSPFSTLNVIPKGDGTGLTSSLIYDNGTNVGIGTTTPGSPLEVSGNIINSNPSQGYLGLTGDLPGYSTGVYPTLKTSNAYLFFSAGGNYSGYIGGSDAVLGLNKSGGTLGVSLNSNGDSYFTGGNLGIGTSSPASALEVNGFTKLGSSAPQVQMAYLTGTTTSVTTGGSVDIPLGSISAAKIISVTVMVEYSANYFTPPEYTNVGGYQYTWLLLGPSNALRILNYSGNSSSIASKPVRALITYIP